MLADITGGVRVGGGLNLPERPIERSVPADEGAGSEEQEPQHGQAKVHAARRVHEEPEKTAKHVHKQRPCVDCVENNDTLLLIIIPLFYIAHFTH